MDSSRRNGFGIVVLAMVLTLCLLVHMWLRAPLIAQVLGPVAYAIAFAMSSIAACIAALIFTDESSFEDKPVRLEPIRATVEVPTHRVGTSRRS